MKRGMVIILGIGIMSFSGQVSAVISTDFESGTLEGWTKGTPYFSQTFVGELLVSDIGNPGTSMGTKDTGAGGGLFAQAPAEYTGDLSQFTGIMWDEYLPDASIVRTKIYLLGTDNTVYFGITSDQLVVTTSSWEERFIPFDWDSGLWELYISSTGSESFENVISNVEAVFISMDVTTSVFAPGWESRIDNVGLVPEPVTLSLLALGGMGLLRRRRYKVLNELW